MEAASDGGLGLFERPERPERPEAGCVVRHFEKAVFSAAIVATVLSWRSAHYSERIPMFLACRGWIRYGLCVSLAPVLAGCASHKTSQYFLAEDPETGERAVYRLEINGQGIGGVVYQFQGAYLPKAAVDVYGGKIPTSLAELNSQTATGEESAAQSIMTRFHSYLHRQAELRADRGSKHLAECVSDVDTETRFFARLLFHASHTFADMISIGQVNDLSPYRFRKLVYFVTTDPLKVSDFDSELRDVQGSIDSLAATLSAVKRARTERANAERAARTAAIGKLTGFFKDHSDPAKYEPTHWIELLTILKGVR